MYANFTYGGFKFIWLISKLTGKKSLAKQIKE